MTIIEVAQYILCKSNASELVRFVVYKDSDEADGRNDNKSISNAWQVEEVPYLSDDWLSKYNDKYAFAIYGGGCYEVDLWELVEEIAYRRRKTIERMDRLDDETVQRDLDRKGVRGIRIRQRIKCNDGDQEG